ncbi:filamin/ABP280 repeat-containing protein [Heterostelium album PN500]|uniref:Filamin/ABP280 repeat-containing protein n=1 Tax=Heterostelium pallidum (strain ATCC 26659 / Pp 5 / PN500) TaxID=670386 RepID=D3BGE5_HETP5|nr:filamin/ABP280 repeat-containing protein [Heterostelium album PN500]EFA79545.1 filamin/ABP280 repeat-containing protein [Heterostelium album PN500]|eukprot:XP_020431666.1 filamin/ABP280 repeat-containing protein [Heterostelium album PN500]
MKNLDLSAGGFNSIPKQVGWLSNLRRVNLTQNNLTKVPGELSLLNPSIDILLVPNPLEYPYCEWIKEGIPMFLQNIRPYMKAYGPNCIVSELQSPLKANAPNQFALTAFDYANKPRISGGDQFEVKMLLDGATSPSMESGASTHGSTFFKQIDCINWNEQYIQDIIYHDLNPKFAHTNHIHTTFVNHHHALSLTPASQINSQAKLFLSNT